MRGTESIRLVNTRMANTSVSARDIGHACHWSRHNTINSIEMIIHLFWYAYNSRDIVENRSLRQHLFDYSLLRYYSFMILRRSQALKIRYLTPHTSVCKSRYCKLYRGSPFKWLGGPIPARASPPCVSYHTRGTKTFQLLGNFKLCEWPPRFKTPPWIFLLFFLKAAFHKQD